jgi:creatinine amidohydrolase
MRNSQAHDANYVRLRPDQLQSRIEASPVAYAPWGALEWHSVHLPVGLDGILAECIAERAVIRTGGVVLPVSYLPITALPNRFSISFRATTVRTVIDELLAELARVGFKVVVLLSGHYAQGHELVLMDAAEAAIKQHGLMVLAAPPMALVSDAYLDHAGRWETAQLLATFPKLVDQRRLVQALHEHPAGHIADLGILGDLPTEATAGSGEIAIEQAIEAIEAWVRQLLLTDDPSALLQFYAQRRADYQGFVERYFNGSYEEAAAAWWADRMKRD